MPSSFLGEVLEYGDVRNRKEVKLNLKIFEDGVSRH
jgi:hypothetical protein